MEDRFSYFSIKSPVTALFKDRGSKFIAYAFPVETEDEIKNHIQRLKEEHPKAVHHCVAWRLGNDGQRFRANDDGEPSGSAGRPMLGQIDSFKLSDVLLVVVRYFGGTLLGVPGLINAYKTASQEALKSAEIIEKQCRVNYELLFGYDIMDEVFRLLKQTDSLIIQQKLQENCKVQAGIPIRHEALVSGRFQDMQGLIFNKIS